MDLYPAMYKIVLLVREYINVLILRMFKLSADENSSPIERFRFTYAQHFA